MDYLESKKIRKNTLTIASGTESTSQEVNGIVPVGLYIPASLSSTSLTFEFSDDDSTFYPLYDTEGTTIGITIGSDSRYVPLNPSDFAGAKFIRIITGSSETSKDFGLVSRIID